MIYTIVVLLIVLLVSLCGNAAALQEIGRLRERLYGAEEWIDPISWEETE